ncbi:MAG: sodium:proton antiporter, partial [Sandaracinaceae bacterium]|nr:sodium:proton antiporter [Sandaracinaceae bacterium]
ALRLVSRERVPMRWQHIMVLGNIKGALSMAAVLALPESISDKPRLVAIVFGVTLVTLLMQALPFKRLLGVLGVVVRQADASLEEARARLVAARSGQRELDSLLEAGLVSRREHAERKALLQREALRSESVLRAAELSGERSHVDMAVLDAQRGALVEAARRAVLEEDAVRERLAEIDEEILRQREKES